MKTQIYITIISLFVFFNLSAQDFIPYQQSFKNQNFASQTIYYGGGENKIIIRNNVLTISFDSYFQESPLKTGNVVEIETLDVLPSISFGNIKKSDGTDTSYQLSIVGNWIVLQSSTGESVSGMYGDFVYDLTPSDPNDNNEPVALFQHNNENYLHTVEPLYPIEGSVLNYEGAINTVVYFDGIGREKQIVNIGASPSNKDIITHFEYDQKGNKTKEYLPHATTQNTGVFSTGALQATIDYYNVSKYENTVNPFSEKITDNSPLDRIVEAAAPGEVWKFNSNLVIISNHTNTIYNGSYPDFTQSWPISIFLDDPYAGGGGTVTLNISNGGGTTEIVFSGGGFSSVNLKLGDITDVVGIDLPNIGFGLLTINNVNSGYGVNITNNTINIYKIFTGIQSFNSISSTLTQDIRTSEQIDYTIRTSSNNTIKFDYSTNTTNEVKLYEIGFNSGNIQDPYLVNNGYYTENQLQKKITKTEDWKPNQTYIKDYTHEEFIDKNGRSVLKRTYNNGIAHDTYYVYNYLGNLTYVLPPEYREGDVISDHSYLSFDWRNFMYSPIGGGGGGGNIEVLNNILNVSFGAGFTTQPLKTSGIVKYLGWTDIPDLLIGSFANGHYIAYIRSGNLYIEGDGTSVGGLSFTANIDLSQFGGGSTDLGLIAYQYKYDDKNRMIEKKIPGKGKEFIVYDKLNRPVLTQDALQRPNNEWLFTKYDAFSRIAYTGIYTHAIEINQNTMQSYFDNQNIGGIDMYEDKDTVNGGYLNSFYSNNNFPDSNIEILTINYYDNYNFGSFTGSNPATVYDVTPTNKTKGMSTGSRIRVLNTNYWITTIMRYNDKGRLIFSYSNNSYLNFTDYIEHKLDFVGKILETSTNHSKIIDKTYTGVLTIDRYEYDNVGRLKKQTQQINNQPIELISKNTYDELGQLITKEVGNEISNSALQEINYKYNVRGWLTGINNESGNNSLVSLASSDLFGFQINYNDPTDINKKLYNGNISETLWKTTSINSTSNLVSGKYIYDYDALNRITEAIDNTTNYNVSGITYDRNGNILSLKREGLLESNTFVTMDELTYDYGSLGGNKLMKVTDIGEDSVGFKDGNKSGDDYQYDINGNMIKDLNKGITNITYNHFNLPKEIEFANGDKIYYTYDATGIKMSKAIILDGIIDGADGTGYAGNYIYENDNLKHIGQPEGYIEPDGSSYRYVYQYKDHLNNVRLSYSDLDGNGSINSSTEILHERNYYPFGLLHKGYNNVINGTVNNRHQYQDQEFTEDLGLNTHEWKYRISDPAIGRFWQVDPLAEDYVYNGVYNFAENRVIDGFELEGLEWQPVNDDRENVTNGADNHTGYTWVGFNEDGSAPEGTVADGIIWNSDETGGTYFGVNNKTNGPKVGFSEITHQGTLDKIGTLDEALQKPAKELVLRSKFELNTEVIVTQGLRTNEQQNNLYAQGRTQAQLNRVGLNNVTAQPNASRVTNARGGQSLHNYGVAFDIVPLRNGTPNWESNQWNNLGALGVRLGLSWGGNWTTFQDRPHFDNGQTVQELQQGN